MQSSSQIVVTHKPTSSFSTGQCPSCHPTLRALKGNTTTTTTTIIFSFCHPIIGQSSDGNFQQYNSLSVCFNGNFPGGPGLASNRMSPFWILLELRVMEVVVTTSVTRRTKLQSKCHHKQTNIQFWMPFLVAQPTVSKH